MSNAVKSDMSLPNDNEITLTKREDLGKPKGLDIEKIIKRVDEMNMPNKDKADLLKALKYSLTHPEEGENADLDRIEQKYLNPQQYDPMIQGYNMPPYGISTPSHFTQMPRSYPQPQPQPPFAQMPRSYPQQVMDPNTQYMTTTHFEILKSKIDSLQYELIDLLRHVKDYTQRYMNAVRQSDLQHIDEYVNGLFDVEKTLAETKKQAAALESTPTQMPDTGMLGKIAGLEEIEGVPQGIKPPIPKPEPETQEGLISRTTNGIKNFFSGIGSNLTGITSLVKSTADMANNVLSKRIIGSDETTPPTQSVPTTPIKPKLSKNEMTVDEYISNMNSINKLSLSPQLPNAKTIISSNLKNINTTLQQPIKPKIVTESVNMNTNLPSAVNKLNKVITNNTSRSVVSIDTNVQPNEPKTIKTTNMNTHTTPLVKKNNIVTSQSMSGGGKKATKLNEKIRLLKLKLTKRNLEEQLNKTKIQKKINTRPKTVHKK